MSLLESIPLSSWHAPIDAAQQNNAINALENGQVLFFPELSFTLAANEIVLLNPESVDLRSKNISYNYLDGRLQGTTVDTDKQGLLKQMLKRFAESSVQLMHNLFPPYKQYLAIGRTSLRPVEIAGRISASYRKDDTRLHVDAFPSMPNQGRRIIRVFANINPFEQPRIWRLGESFEAVAKRFLPQTSPPMPGSSWLLQKLRITKSKRSLYDHYMLHIHDAMKADTHYQATVPFEEVALPAKSSWIVCTDHVSHAALAGQHVLEQTFYLPVEGMNDAALSPLQVLERLLAKPLV